MLQHERELPLISQSKSPPYPCTGLAQDFFPRPDNLTNDSFSTSQPSTWNSADRVPLENSKKAESIFTYYNPAAEVDKVRELRRMGKAEEEVVRAIDHYSRENIIHFLNEYVGKVPYSEISFLLEGKSLTYAGLDMISQMQQTAAINGPESREQADLVGMDAVRSEIHNHISLHGNTDISVVKISPAYVGNYSFAFIFTPELNRDGSLTVRERIIRFPEKKDTVKESRSLYTQLAGDCGYTDAREFLRNPIVQTGSTSHGVDRFIMEHVGVPQDRIDFAQTYETTNRNELKKWIDEYVSILLETSRLPQKSAEYTAGVAKLRQYLTAIYNRSDEIRKDLKDKRHIEPQRVFYDDPYLLFMQYASQQAYVTGGGSCPVAGVYGGGAVGSAGYLDPYSLFYSSLPFGWGADRAAHEQQKQMCTTCGKSSADNHYHCCGWDKREDAPCKERYADETHLPPHKRTPICRNEDCKFKFSC